METRKLKSPRIGLKEYQRRQRELMELMGQDSIAIISSATPTIRNGDVTHVFRQNSDFYYLCGFEEPSSVLAIVPGRPHGETILFCRERDADVERWDGSIVGPDRAAQMYGLDDAFPIEDIDDILPGLMEGKARLYYALGSDRSFDNRVLNWMDSVRIRKRGGSQKTETPPGELVQLSHYLHDQRLYKSAAEIHMLRHASDITVEAHKRAMTMAAPGIFEYELEAEMAYIFRKSGGKAPAYPMIVGSGDNACILHYVDNSKQLVAGELVLIDAGCEFEYYAADVTRTFPVDGVYTGEQRAVYEVVLAAQGAAIREVQPGNDWSQPHGAAVRILCEGMSELGLLAGSVDEIVETEAYRQFYMHKTGHWLGLDVHDVGEYHLDGQWRVFEPGMVTTVEPGIYISPADTSVAERWRGIGIRIEDDVLVTPAGHEVLTAALPKEIAEIEALMAAD